MSFLTLPVGIAARPQIVGASIPTALRNVLPSSLFVAGMEAFVASTAPRKFVWDAVSVAADDGATIIKPSDVAGPDPGRWILQSVSVFYAEPYVFDLSGVYSGAAVPGFWTPPRLVLPGSAPRTLQRVFLFRRTAGTAGSTTVQLYRNGNPVLAAALSVTAGAGDYAAATTAAFNPGENVFNALDYIEPELQAVETHKPGPPPGPEGLTLALLFF